MVTDPQVSWWKEKIDQCGAAQSAAYKLRSVGSLQPTHLGPTQPKGCRNKAREQRVKFQDLQLFPKVPRSLRHPLDLELAMHVSHLDTTMDARSWCELRILLRNTFNSAFEAVLKAAEAYEELCKHTEKLKDNTEATDILKKAKILARDAVLWRWFGLTGWIYNQAEAEFFKSYGHEIESQLMNSVGKIRQRLMQQLMRRPCWLKLEKMLISVDYHSLTPELQGLLNRIHYTIEKLGGLQNPVLQEARRLSEDEEKEWLKSADQDREHEELAEQKFEAAVLNNQGRMLSESVVDFLCLDDFEDADFDFHPDPEQETDVSVNVLDPIFLNQSNWVRKMQTDS